jgi:hypothetical protein
VLYKVGGPNRTDSLPSWVPDWKHGWAHLSTAPITLHNGFSAGGASPLFYTDNNVGMLKLRGTIIDTVSWVDGLVPFFDELPFLTYLKPELHLYTNIADDRWQAYQGRYSVSGHNASMRASSDQRLLKTSTRPFCKTHQFLRRKKGKLPFKAWYRDNLGA